MYLFYTPDIVAEHYMLSEDESKHCSRVLRLIVGDIVFLVDGKGGFFETRIIDNHPKRCLVEVIKTTRDYQKRKNFLHIAIAPTKNIERFEWFLEKATEIGIDEITPLLCDHSERKDIKLDRLNKIIEAAMKQSLKAYHPKLNELITFKNFIAQNHSEKNKLIAHCEFAKKELFIQSSSLKNNLVLIGPEGDFSMDEIALAAKNNFIAISLGEARLRTETAGIAIAVLANSGNEN